MLSTAFRLVQSELFAHPAPYVRRSVVGHRLQSFLIPRGNAPAVDAFVPRPCRIVRFASPTLRCQVNLVPLVLSDGVEAVADAAWPSARILLPERWVAQCADEPPPVLALGPRLPSVMRAFVVPAHPVAVELRAVHPCDSRWVAVHQFAHLAHCRSHSFGCRSSSNRPQFAHAPVECASFVLVMLAIAARAVRAPGVAGYPVAQNTF